MKKVNEIVVDEDGIFGVNEYDNVDGWYNELGENFGFIFSNEMNYEFVENIEVENSKYMFEYEGGDIEYNKFKLYCEKVNEFVKDNNNFIVSKTSITTRGFAGKAGGGKEKVEVVGYYTSFQNALNWIAKEKFYLNKGEYKTIKEYITVWKELKDGLDELMNKIGF